MGAKFKTIFLQRFEDDEDISDDTTWCYDQVFEYDIEYIQYSEYDKLEQQNKALRELVGELYDFLDKIKDHNNPHTSPVFSRDSLRCWINTYQKKLKEIGGE